MKTAPAIRLKVKYPAHIGKEDQLPHQGLHIDVVYDDQYNYSEIEENDYAVGKLLFSWLVNGVGSCVWDGFKDEAEKHNYFREAKAAKNLTCCSDCNRRYKCWTER